ncbi:B12-binding domain-containing radical SAM protein [Streptomyces sediminimaris]|uniref:B12-binding domain-containing radical SAM protein n=1 Tax=Streptomyces sediminimaris TaxID=3383721 RepID=UPI00399ADA48
MSPRYARSFGTFDHAFAMTGAKAFMPPQGILVIAAWFAARGWRVRVVDENVRPVSATDLEWADVMMVSGMHVQHDAVVDVVDRARRRGVITALGGPSVSASPEWYPEPDLLHLGELGDATVRLAERLERDVSPPAGQESYRTAERLPLEEFPVPAYGLIDLDDYFLASVQASSGCPFQCEFCDIPALYGRKPRLKSPDQVLRELDAIVAAGRPDAVYFVDDNFIADPHAARRLLEALVAWQEKHGHPLDFACEATLNISGRRDLLSLMRRARFTTMFVGIETPDEAALKAMNKRHNLRSPILEAVSAINAHGIEVVSGVILGLDTDSRATYDNVCRFIDASAIPLLTVNLLHALPRTPLWHRLEAEDRLLHDPGDRQSNVDFLLSEDLVSEGWRQVVRHAYEPRRLYERFAHQVRDTYPHRLPVADSRYRRSPRAIRRGLRIAGRVLWQCGVRADYRREFWRLASVALRRGDVEALISAALVGHHLITFAREALAGRAERAFYAPPRGQGGDAVARSGGDRRNGTAGTQAAIPRPKDLSPSE